MNKKTIYIHHHLGLGDHIICNGLVRYLSKQYNIKLFCKYQNIINIQTMYMDDTNIVLIPISNDTDAEQIYSSIKNKHNNIYIRLGIALNKNISYLDLLSWDEFFYSKLNLPYEYSWNYFQYNKSHNQNPIPKEPFLFICNKGSDNIDGIDYRKINMNLKHIYSNYGNFFDNIDLITDASEIHCINSAYIHLIDRIHTNSSNLYFHKNFIYKPYSEFKLKKKWIVI